VSVLLPGDHATVLASAARTDEVYGPLHLSVRTSQYSPDTFVLRCVSVAGRVLRAERIVTMEFVMNQVRFPFHARHCI